MAGLKRRASQVWPAERVEQEHGLYSLHRMFDIVGTHLTHRDVRVLSSLFVELWMTMNEDSSEMDVTSCWHLGSIICDIKFSELTYLDAFWRDHINGSLLEALKGVFMADSLKQAVGHEAIKLLVDVDEEDYELGRQKLLRNLMLQALP